MKELKTADPYLNHKKAALDSWFEEETELISRKKKRKTNFYKFISLLKSRNYFGVKAGFTKKEAVDLMGYNSKNELHVYKHGNNVYNTLDHKLKKIAGLDLASAPIDNERIYYIPVNEEERRWIDTYRAKKLTTTLKKLMDSTGNKQIRKQGDDLIECLKNEQLLLFGNDKK